LGGCGGPAGGAERAGIGDGQSGHDDISCLGAGRLVN
jgi:hypothetical protein